MRRIILGNPTTDNQYRTYLADDYSSGTTPQVLSNVSFAGDDLALFGEVGEELSEIKKLSGITGKEVLNLASELNFDHKKDTPVYKVLWDFIVLEGRATTADNFAVISESPIQWDKSDTIYYHKAGTATWEYRFRFYNSITGQYSEHSPTVSGGGFDRNQVGQMVMNVRTNIRDFDGRLITDFEIIEAFNDAQRIIYARNPRYRFLKVDGLHADNGIPVLNNQDTYSLASLPGFGHLDIIRFRYTQGGTDRVYGMRRTDNVDFQYFSGDLNAMGDDNPTDYTVLPPDDNSANGYIKIWTKVANNGVARLYFDYYSKMEDLDTVDSRTKVPLPDLLEKYAIAAAERIRGNETKADKYEDLFFGPQERADKHTYGLMLLDMMDAATKNSPSQARSLKYYRGQRGASRLLGDTRRGLNSDQIKERYF